MHRKSQIYAPGALHRIIAQGIERRKTFNHNADHNHLLVRLGRIAKESQTRCLAWALIPKHFHL
jgi:hypothetical protein